ncbi:ComEC/Rec2 family competence protein [Holdemanella biformis]|uniref:MBL fold metallo-hydrolase n=1 Tax=Holdemanella biformis TaxID=1735 RepID=A0A395W915_9FIRM|nr:MBL fold metallo-hydrolase [Holdemanella biformis]RGU67937.1 MBL fold metallo-hydrolase [Holdemanella biformis]RGU89058.1 MBL fold metallo-hydrolase [Holdemanella biformis]
MMLIISLGFLACIILKDPLCIFCFSFCFLLYLNERFHSKRILIVFTILSVFSIVLVKPCKEAEKGIYTISEIKQSYYVAKNQRTRVLVQSDLDLNFNDQIQVDSLEPIHTDDNFTLFSFTKYNASKNIFYKTRDVRLIKKSTSLKSKLYDYISSQKNSKVLLSLYYGIHEDTIDEIYTMLGYGYISAYFIVFNLLKRKYEDKKIRISLLILSILFGSFFVFTLSLTRFILYQISYLFFKSKSDQIGFTILCFSILYPTQVLSISFVLPILLQLVSYFCTEHKWIVQKMVVISVLFIYFKKVDIVSFLLFNLLRKLYGCVFLLGMFIPDFLTLKIPSLTIHYAPQYVFILVFIVVYIQCLKHFKWIYMILFLIPFLEVFCNPFFQVYTLNIGQGDCSVIVEPFYKSVVMIDCGQSLYRDNVERIIFPFLENKNIHTIDTLILTHDDFDHSGGYDRLKEKVKIKQVIKDSKDKVNVEYPFYLLLQERMAKDENDSSIISYFTYDHLNYLFMGDASKEIEKQLMDTYDLKADVIKVGHHGSNTSSDTAFLDSLDCRIALISAGYKNKYDHPSTETLKTLDHLHIHTFCTSTNGSIAIYSLHDFAFVVTNDGLFGIIH